MPPKKNKTKSRNSRGKSSTLVTTDDAPGYFDRIMPVPLIYSFRRTFSYSSVSLVTGVSPTFFTFTTSLSLLPNAAEFSTLFDSYRINAVRIEFYPTITASTTGSSLIPLIATCIDYDNVVAPTTVNEVFEYQTCKKQYFKNIHARNFRPRVSMAVYRGVTTTGYGLAPVGTFFDCANPDIPYFGIKGCIDNASPGGQAAQTVKVTGTMYFQCRSVR